MMRMLEETIMDDLSNYVLVDVGSGNGSSIQSMLPYFHAVHGIELDSACFEVCKNRFVGNRNVYIHTT